MENNSNNSSRRKFIQLSSLAAGATLASPLQMFGQTANNTKSTKNIQSKGIAGKDTYSPLELWSFERRAVGETDVLVEIKYSSICHSDIHTIRGHWGKQPFPQVPGHEIAGIVKAVGKGVTKFKVGDRVGVGVIADSCLTCKPCKEAQEQHCVEGMVGTLRSALSGTMITVKQSKKILMITITEMI